MSSVEQELWNIFTFYTLHGNPLDPEHMRAQQFVKFARECQIVGPGLQAGDPAVLEADVNVVYTAEVRRKRGRGSKKMNFSDFLTALMKLSVRVYPTEARRSVDDAFQRLLMDNVLRLAGRRQPESVDVFLEDPDVQNLFFYYQDALEQIFQFYATSPDVKGKGIGSTASEADFRSTVSGSGRKALNSMKSALGYPEFLKFASDFDLSSSVILSTLELGDIYLSSIREVDPETHIRKLTFDEFWEALVRCALIAYSKISKATVLDKVRGLFLYMWRAINRSVPRAFSQRRNVSTYHGDLLAGAMLFNKRFTAQWAEDGYRDYLNPDAAREESGRSVLRRIMGRSSEDPLGAAGGSSPLADSGAHYGVDMEPSSPSSGRARGGGGDGEGFAEASAAGGRRDGGARAPPPPPPPAPLATGDEAGTPGRARWEATGTPGRPLAFDAYGRPLPPGTKGYTAEGYPIPETPTEASPRVPRFAQRF